MTVAIGLVCSDGVIVASDSMASSGNTARPICKVFAEEDLRCVWTAAGSVYVIEEVEQVIRAAAKDGQIKPSCISPDLSGIRSRLASKITEKMKQCYDSALPFGLHQQINQQHHPFITDFLLLGWSRETPWFLEIDNTGQLNWHTSAGFAAVGSGGEFASVAQALMKHHVEGRPISVDDGLLVAYRAIQTTCEVSSHHVGLPVWLAVATTEGCRVLDRAETQEVEDSVEGWKQIERDSLTALRASISEVTPEPPPSLATPEPEQNSSIIETAD